MRRLMLLTTLIALPFSAFGQELPVSAVVMSSGGLMQVERRGELPADGVARFRVPLSAVDDVLKSLVVRDPAGRVESVRLPAADLAGEAFRGLPLRPADFASRAALLNALRGQAVEAKGVQGRIAEAAEVEGGLRLALVTPTGLVSVVLGEGEEARLQDAGLAARIARAAAALATAQSNEERLVEVVLRGERAREVSLTSLVSAPVWKPSWRLVLPQAGGAAEARLQGWAVVENLSGADWERVRLTLVSGAAAGLRQPLYAPVEVPREELPLRLAEQLGVTADTGARPPPPMPVMPAPAAPAPAAELQRGRARSADLAQAPIAAAAAAAQAEATPGRITYTLPEPVTLPAGSTANLPFLDAAIPAERVWWVQDRQARHPLQAALLANRSAQTLPDGIVTVFGDDGHWLGDAELRALPPGGERLLGFGRDRDVEISSAEHNETRIRAVALRPGRVTLQTVRREEVAFAIDPRGASGRLLIDLPRRGGAEPRFAVAAEGTFGLRHSVALNGQKTELRLPFEREVQQSVPLWDPGLGDPLLLEWRRLEQLPSVRRLPGGPGTLETLRELLQRLPPEAEGREAFAALVEQMAEARRLLDAFETEWRAHAAAEAALGRARAAVEDRSGAAREEARQALNRASQAVERAGARADAAWSAWQGTVRGILAASAG
ncbi:DUF4139 domain-containing protein [Pseudoroseomonas cervicalis]|uniref:DUF4139 domain-containing protein n=1 Tax=Teichococcus cervicalis TaxID=204525 RepID=UPI0022F191EA|nr:DUF4139 domain-containing protein [Pseudoroseomonas cervicalis]WBV45157.1 hypothetical protein PFY06_20170 [Pseudoroseomonas cervicalis]